MKWFLIPMLFVLAACQAPSQEKIEAGIDQTLPLICAAVDIGWVGWTAADVQIDVKLRNKLTASYVAVKGVCLNPPGNTVEALASLAKAYADFKSALKAAKNGVST